MEIDFRARATLALALLPAGFDPARHHTLEVVEAGACYTPSLEGAQAQQRTFDGAPFPVLLNGQPDPVATAPVYVAAYYLTRWGNDEAKDNNGTVIPDC